MTKFIFAATILVVVAFAISCKSTKTVTEPEPPKEVPKTPKTPVQNNPAELAGTNWKVIYIQELDARTLAEGNAPQILLGEENEANVKLSVNNCFGSYKASPTSMVISEEGCTEKCCDNAFDAQLMKLLRKNGFNYELKAGKLLLWSKDAEILLEKA